MDPLSFASGISPIPTSSSTGTLALRSLPRSNTAARPETPTGPIDSVTLSGEQQDPAPLAASQMQRWFAQSQSSSNSGGVAVGAVQKTNPPSTPDPHFHYDARPLQDLRGSVNWTPGSHGRSGTSANEQVTSDYQHLNAEMQKYLAGDPMGRKLPPVTDFAGMAKFGSRLAGEQIRNLEDLEKGVHGDPKALTDAARNLANPQGIEQGLKMGAASAGRNAADENLLLAAVATPFVAGKIAGETTAESVATMGKMRDILVEGNTTIHDSAGRAYDAFLKGESSGEGGLESLRKAGYFPGSKEDPMGMYTQAFSQYDQARDLGLAAQKESNPARRKELEAQRETLIKEANIKLFIHEQKSLEQPHMYGDQDMKNAVRSIGGSMTLDDPHGKYRLLPNGGDWTDFDKRMGFTRVSPGTPGAIDVLNPDGSHTHYKVDPSAVGTVSHYSNSRSAGSLAAAMSQNQPSPLHQPPTTATGQGVDRVGSNLSQGNYLQAVGDAAQIPDRLLADAAKLGGQAVKSHAEDSGLGGYQKMIAPDAGLIDQVGGALQLTGAALEHTLGQGIETVGEGINSMARARDEVWNFLFK